MLVQFAVGNFLSFKHPVNFSMVASSDVALEETNVLIAGRHRLSRSAIIYGANASGKSNLLTAMAFMRRMVVTSSKESQANEQIAVRPFALSTETEGRPSLVEIVFRAGETTYRYGFEADERRVHSEWLFTVPTIREAELFTRDGATIKVSPTRFREGRGLESKTRDNALFLSVCAQFNGEISRQLLAWFQNYRFIHGLEDLGYLESTVDKLKDAEQKRRILEMVRVADLSISDLEGKKEEWKLDDFPATMPEELKRELIKTTGMRIELKTVHRKFDKENNETGQAVFDLLRDESSGTIKLLTLAGPLLDTLEAGSVLVVDELDARLHPLLTRLIVGLYNSHLNKNNAQLIFASQDSTLLDNTRFRRDQIWFTEKDCYGATSLYSLADLKGVRKSAIFGKDYILGKYGAIPFIGDPRHLMCDSR